VPCSASLPLPKSSPCKTMPLVFMTRGEREARSSKFYPGALISRLHSLSGIAAVSQSLKEAFLVLRQATETGRIVGNHCNHHRRMHRGRISLGDSPGPCAEQRVPPCTIVRGGRLFVAAAEVVFLHGVAEDEPHQCVLGSLVWVLPPGPASAGLVLRALREICLRRLVARQELLESSVPCFLRSRGSYPRPW
jgi:hypothetical protein